MIKGWKEFERDWEQIRKDMLNTKVWGNGLGSPKFYKDFAKEIGEDVHLLDEDIEFWNERKNKSREDCKLRRECQEIIRGLVRGKERLLWKVEGFLSIGRRLKKYLEKEASKANQSSPQD